MLTSKESHTLRFTNMLIFGFLYLIYAFFNIIFVSKILKLISSILLLLTLWRNYWDSLYQDGNIDELIRFLLKSIET